MLNTKDKNPIPKEAPPLVNEMEFLEIDVEKQLENLKEEKDSSNPLLFEKFKSKNDIAPLYVHEIFKKKSEGKHILIGETTEKPKGQSKNANNNVQGSIFLMEKLEKQIYEARQKKLELKMAKKNLSNSERKNIESFHKSGKDGSDEVFFNFFSYNI